MINFTNIKQLLNAGWVFNDVGDTESGVDCEICGDGRNNDADAIIMYPTWLPRVHSPKSRKKAATTLTWAAVMETRALPPVRGWR